MTASSFPHALPVHPHQLEVQEFDNYDLLIDLRPAEAYRADHIPGALSMPQVLETGPTALVIAPDTERAPDTAATLAMEPNQPLAYDLDARLGALPAGRTVLLYCDQGGALSQAVGASLVARGVAVDILPGGWPSYRRWVAAGLDILARSLSWRWLRSEPGGASQALLQGMRSRGQQVLSLGELVTPSGLPGLVFSRKPTSGGALDSQLVDALRRLDPSLPVWVDDVVLASMQPLLPRALQEALAHAPNWTIDAAPAVRAALSAGDQRDLVGQLVLGLEDVEDGLPEILRTGLDRYRHRSSSSAVVDPLASFLVEVLAPWYHSPQLQATRQPERSLQLHAAEAAYLGSLVETLLSDQISP